MKTYAIAICLELAHGGFIHQLNIRKGQSEEQAITNLLQSKGMIERFKSGNKITSIVALEVPK